LNLTRVRPWVQSPIPQKKKKIISSEKKLVKGCEDNFLTKHALDFITKRSKQQGTSGSHL
jgi:hypothetical protein